MLATLMSEDAGTPDDAAAQMAWRGIRSKILAVRGEYAVAERLARAAVAHGEQTDFLSLRGDAHVDLAIVLMLAGKDPEALDQFTTAMKLFERKGNIVALAAAGALRDTVAARVTA